jgi:amidase
MAIARFPTALEVASKIRSGETTPTEALHECLERIDRLNPTLNAVIWRDDDAAEARAQGIEAGLATGKPVGPFAGVPITVKDLTPAAGQPVTYGSAGARGEIAPQDELVIAALRRAGFVFCGRTNTPEFGPLPVTENARYGITRNPWDPERSPGGSSGGSAAAVASGMVPVGHANDGGGSIRIPASCCGLVGLKASRWRVPSVTPGWLGMSVEGVVCHSVADAAAILDCISEPNPLVWEQAPAPTRPFSDEVGADPGSMRIALLTTSALGIELDPACRQAVASAGALLESLGHEVYQLDHDLLDPAVVEPFLHVVNTAYGAFDGIDWSRVEPHNAAGRVAGMAVDGLTMIRSLNELRRATYDTVAHWRRDFDVLVTPTMAIEPPVAGEVLAAADEQPDLPPLTVLAMVAFTVPYNVSGQPAISLPLHHSERGLPVGVQIVGAPWGEVELFRLASQVESAAPWRDRHPLLDTIA